jgi:NitT/TauT family transport system ATP-binding protein
MILITHDPEEAVFLSDRVYVSTPRPMRVAGVVDIDLPRFRTHDVKLTPEFAAHERAVLRLLRNESQPGLGGAGAGLQ